MIDADQPSLDAQSGRIRHRAPQRVGPPMLPRPVDETNNGGRPARRGRDLVQCGKTAMDEGLPKHQILWWVARQCQLGQQQDVGLLVIGPAHGIDDDGGVALDITNDRVDLSPGDTKLAHARRVPRARHERSVESREPRAQSPEPRAESREPTVLGRVVSSQ